MELTLKTNGIICYSCAIPGHKASKFCKNKGRAFYNFCKSSSHNDKICHKSKDKSKTVDDAKHIYAFKVKEMDFRLACDKIFSGLWWDFPYC